MTNKPTVVTAPAQRETTSVDSFISQAIASNAPVETLERLFALHKEVQAEQAKSAFIHALADFQRDCPKIAKTKKVLNKDGRSVRYQYAPLDTIIEQAKGALAKHGLSYRWETKNEQGFITAVATVTHILGHSESSEFKVPIDTEGFMTAPQKYASALTFAKRYSLCNALGISTGDEDTDATDVGKQADVKSKKSKIMFLLRRLGHEPKAKEAKAKKQEVEKAVEELTQLKLVEANYEEIIGRLEMLVSEREEYEKSQAA